MGFSRTNPIFIPVFSKQDSFLISFARKLINNSDAQGTFLDAAGAIKSNPAIKEAIRAIEQIAPNRIHLLDERVVEIGFLRKEDLMLISSDSWKGLVKSKSLWLSNIPSTLIVINK